LKLKPETTCEAWWNSHTLHRDDGPAVIDRDSATNIVICRAAEAAIADLKRQLRQ
jgi:hypothetical protein